jgi:hypothetical protein
VLPLRLAAALRSVAIAAIALAVLVPSAALAQAPAGTGGAAPAQAPVAGAAPTQAPVAAAAASAAAPRPVVDAITCRTGCLGISRATPGSVVRISGEGDDDGRERHPARPSRLSRRRDRSRRRR